MLEDLVEGKAEVEKTLNSLSSDLQSQEKKAEEGQQQLITLRQTLAQLSEREREVLFDSSGKSLLTVDFLYADRI